MSFVSTNYHVSPGEHGTNVIEVTGRCTQDERVGVAANCTRRYKLIPFPNAVGAVLKSHDGTLPRIVEVTPSTFDAAAVYECVKVDGYCNPFAFTQPDGPYAGKTVLEYYMRYQEVGGVA